MKRTYLYITLLFAVMFMASCEKDENKITVLPLSEVNAPQMTLEGLSEYVTEEALINFYPSVLSWTKTSFGGLEVPVTYTLEIDTAADFSSSKKTSMGVGVYSYAISGKVLNNWGIDYNLDTKDLKRVDLFIRVGASVYVGSNTTSVNPIDTAFSDAVVIGVTPMLLETPFIYVPGNHQGWDPESAPHIYSPLRNNVYTGYVYLNGGFKFTLFPAWTKNSNYGAGSAPGKLSTADEAGNLEAAPGYYFVTADLVNLTYSIGNNPVEWTVIGEAVGGWDDANQKVLTYDLAKGKLTVTANMAPGKFKFRRDNDWEQTLGVGAEEGIVSSEGGDIDFTGTTGTYTIVLDLSTEPALYNYTITKVE